MAKDTARIAMAAMPSAPSMDHDWQCEEDARTLVRAAEIKGNAARHAKAVALLKDSHKELKKAIAQADGRGHRALNGQEDTDQMTGQGYRRIP